MTHPGARYAGPIWLALGLVVYLVVRRRAQIGLLAEVEPIDELPAGAEFRRVLVPMKLGADRRGDGGDRGGAGEGARGPTWTRSS